MTSPGPSDPGEQPGGQGPEDREGALRPTSAAALSVWAGAGLVGGWLLRPVGAALWSTAPFVTWTQPVALLVVAMAVGLTAWVTWRTLHVRGERLEPHRAVNRFVLGRAIALVGALTAGGYAGYAVSWLGLGAELAGQRVWRSLAAAVAAVLVMAAALLLERACRIRSGHGEP